MRDFESWASEQAANLAASTLRTVCFGSVLFVASSDFVSSVYFREIQNVDDLFTRERVKWTETSAQMLTEITGN